jgi:hypothetical protein
MTAYNCMEMGRITNCLNALLHENVCCAAATVLLIFCCNVKNLPLLEELPLKNSLVCNRREICILKWFINDSVTDMDL